MRILKYLLLIVSNVIALKRNLIVNQMMEPIRDFNKHNNNALHTTEPH